MVPGPAALRSAHFGADLRPPLDESDIGVSQIARGAGRRWHPPQNHRHRLVVKHKLEQRESLRTTPDWKELCGGNERVWMEGLMWTWRLAACSPTGPSVAGSFTQLAQLKCTLIFLFCREFLIYYHLFFLISFSPSLLSPLIWLYSFPNREHFSVWAVLPALFIPPFFLTLFHFLLLGWYTRLARPSYSDMAALIELGEFKKIFLFKCFNFDFVVPFFGKLLFWGLLSTALFSGFALSSAVAWAVMETRGRGGDASLPSITISQPAYRSRWHQIGGKGGGGSSWQWNTWKKPLDSTLSLSSTLLTHSLAWTGVCKLDPVFSECLWNISPPPPQHTHTRLLPAFGWLFLPPPSHCSILHSPRLPQGSGCEMHNQCNINGLNFFSNRYCTACFFFFFVCIPPFCF